LFRSLSPTAPVLVVSGHEDPVIRKEVAQIGAGVPAEASRDE